MQPSTTKKVKFIDPFNGAAKYITIPPTENDLDSKVRDIFKVHEDASVQLIDIATRRKVSHSMLLQSEGREFVVYVRIFGKENTDPLRQYDSEVVTFTEMFYGMTIREKGKHIVVKAFVNKPDGSIGRAEASGQIRIGDAIRRIDGTLVTGCNYNSVVEYLRSKKRPIDIEFFLPKPRSIDNLFAVHFDQPNLDMTIASDGELVFIKRVIASGYAGMRGVMVGDVIHAVQGEVITGSNYDKVVDIIKESGRPLVIVFRRPEVSTNIEIINLERLNTADRLSISSACSATSRSSSAARESLPVRPSFEPPRETECNMEVEELLEVSKEIKSSGLINAMECEYMEQMILGGNKNIKRALQTKNKALAIALVRSPFFTTWNKLLYRGETIILTGKVNIKKKEYQLLLTSDPQLIFVNSQGSAELTIPCSQLLKLKQLSVSELSIDTHRKRYVMADPTLGAGAWLSIIRQYILVQGYMTVESRKGRLFSKKRYFVLEGRNLRYYKKQSEVGKNVVGKLLLWLDNFHVEIVDEKYFSFRITTTTPADKGKAVTLIAPTIAEFSRWMGALKGLELDKK